MKKYICKVYFELTFDVTVLAASAEEAQKKAMQAPINEKDLLLAEFVPDSQDCEIEDVVEVEE